MFFDTYNIDSQSNNNGGAKGNGHADEDFMALLLELQDRARAAPTHRER